MKGSERRAVVLLAAVVLVATGCSTRDPIECGVDLGDGRARFCAADGTGFCICATNRCAREVDPGECPSGYRYTDGEGECVAEEGTTAMASSEPSHQCPVGDADADADADADGGGDADAELPPPALGEPVVIAGGEQPRVVRFGSSLLVEWISDQSTVSAPDEIRAQLYTPALVPVGSVASATVDFPTRRLDAAISWATCADTASGPTALFAHWQLDTATGEYTPRLFWVHVDGEGSVEVIERTTELADPADGTLRTVVVAGNGAGCFLVQVRDDGPGVVSFRFTRVGEPGSTPAAVEVFHTSEPWTPYSESSFPPDPSAPPDPPWPAVWVDGDGSVAVLTGAWNTLTQRLVLIGQVLNASAERVWTATADTFAVLADFGSGDVGCLGVESAFYNAIGAKGQWLLAPVVVVRRDDSGGRCLHLVSANRSSTSPFATAVEITGSCPHARLPAWVPGPGAMGYLAYSAWDGGSGMRAMLGATDGHGIDPVLGIFEHSSSGVFPRLSVDESGRAWMGWVQIPGGSMDFEFAVQHWTSEMDPVAGWPDDGVTVTAPGEALPLESTAMLSPPLADGDGAIVGWTRIIDSTHRSVVLRRIDDPR